MGSVWICSVFRGEGWFEFDIIPDRIISIRDILAFIIYVMLFVNTLADVSTVFSNN